MDSKIVKLNLKEAKEAIKNKKYSDAIKLCKGILRDDRTNYMALILFGAALQETEQRQQAPNAYRKAVEVSPELPLAWQGLASFYEKDDTDEGKEELLKVYQQLLNIESDPTRVIEVSNKLAQLAQRMGRTDDQVQALYRQQAVLTTDPERTKDNWCRITSALAALQTLSEQQAAKLEEALGHVIDDSSSLENMENLRRYLRLLYRSGKLSELAAWSRRTSRLFPRAEFALELVCRAYVEAGGHSPLDELFPQAHTDLLALSEGSGLGLLAEGAYLLRTGKTAEARDVLQRASGVLQNSPLVWSLLAESHLQLHNPEDAEACATLGLKVISGAHHLVRERVLQSLTESSLRALARSDQESKLRLALTKANERLKENRLDSLALECCAVASVAMKNTSDTDSVLENLKISASGQNLLTALRCLLIIQRQDHLEQVEPLLNSVVNPEMSSAAPYLAQAWYELGEQLTSSSNPTQALTFYMKAAKTDPLFCKPFVRLADFYRLHSGDLDKARRCYQKAFRLNPRCEQAGIGLSDIYRVQNNMEANLELLTSATTNSGARWAWLRLGLLHLQMGNTDEAINQLLAASRSDPDSSSCWESLGDAYMVRGSYTAAIKCFQRVLELSPGALYAAIQVASIKLLLGQLTEAAEGFLAVLARTPDYVPALKGLGETLLSQARDYLARQLDGRARATCEQALGILTSAARRQGSLVCVWKLMGDSCMLPAALGPHVSLKVCPTLLGRAEGEPVEVDLEQLLQLASRCYCRAVSLQQDDSLAWHDLALSFLTQARLCLSAIRSSLLQKALAAARQATKLAPANTHHWNLLGTIAAHSDLNQPKLAQHAFLRAIQGQPSNAQAWSNLGALYLNLGNPGLAHQAFAAAQRSEPSYNESWIGQALIAEGMGHADAMDLFRHSALLATHPESGLGYSHWVCSSLLAGRTLPYQQQSLLAATDQITWYTERRTDNACAHNLLGVLLERQGLLRGAAQAYQKALDVALKSGEHVDAVRTNLARVLSSLGRHQEAIEQLRALSASSFSSQCILALAHFRAEQYQESYASYEAVGDWLANNDTQKSHVMVAMAAMAYKFQGAEAAKTQLFKCAQLRPASVAGLLALCALGLLHQDLQLSRLALQELRPFQDDPAYLADIALLQAFTFFVQGQFTESVSSLSKAVHRHPGHAPLWLNLAVLLLSMYPKATPGASAPCAASALRLGGPNVDLSKVPALVSLSHLQAGHARRSLLEAQRAAHLYPDRPEGWAVLVAAVLPRCVARNNSQDAHWLAATVGMVRRHQQCSSRALTQWLSDHERKAALLCQQLK